MGLIYATLGEHEAAVEQFIAATRLDQYLAVASVLLSSPSTILLTLNQQQLLPMWCLKLLTRSLRPCFQGLRRGSALSTRQPIYVRNIFPCFPIPLIPLSSSNYTQLGLAFKLYSAEILFNKGYSPLPHFFLSLTVFQASL